MKKETSTLQKLFAAADAVKAGQSLENPATWKNRQMLMNVCLVLIGTIPKFINIDLDDQQINAISYGAATLMGVLNTYFTAATSDKVGLPVKS